MTHFLVLNFYFWLLGICMVDIGYTQRHKEPKGRPKIDAKMNKIKIHIQRYVHCINTYKMNIHRIEVINQATKDPR